jgi:hypothetical protein
MARRHRLPSLVLALVTLGAPLAAQPVWSARAPDFAARETFRLRNLGGGSGEELYLALAGNLATGSARDAFNGSWALGSGPTGAVAFTLGWNAATSTLSLGLGSQLTGVSFTSNTAAVQGSWSVPSFGYAGVASDFSLFRFYGRAAGSAIAALTHTDATGTTTLVMDGSPLALDNGERLLAVDATRDFTLAGRISTALCSAESCRLELGVGRGAVIPVAMVPEPRTAALVGTGLMLVALVVRGRRRFR